MLFTGLTEFSCSCMYVAINSGAYADVAGITAIVAVFAIVAIVATVATVAIVGMVAVVPRVEAIITKFESAE